MDFDFPQHSYSPASSSQDDEVSQEELNFIFLKEEEEMDLVNSLSSASNEIYHATEKALPSETTTTTVSSASISSELNAPIQNPVLSASSTPFLYFCPESYFFIPSTQTLATTTSSPGDNHYESASSSSPSASSSSSSPPLITTPSPRQKEEEDVEELKMEETTKAIESKIESNNNKSNKGNKKRNIADDDEEADSDDDDDQDFAGDNDDESNDEEFEEDKSAGKRKNKKDISNNNSVHSMTNAMHKQQIEVSSKSSATSNRQGISLTILDGFNKEPKEKQPSGHNNKQAMPIHSLQVACTVSSYALLPPQETLRVTVSLACFKHKFSKHKKQIKETLCPPVLLDRSAIHPSNQDSSGEKCFFWLARFEDIILTQTSHMNGGRLFLRFSLVLGETVLASIDSAGFQTITTRGLKKRADKAGEPPAKRGRKPTAQKNMSNNNNNNSSETINPSSQKQKIVKDEPQETAVSLSPILAAIDPSIGITNGRQFVLITGKNFVVDPSASVLVRFDKVLSPEIYCVNMDRILCETPPHDEGVVDVTVSFDGGSTFAQGNLKYRYVDHSTSQGKEAILQGGLRKVHNQNSNNSNQNNNKSSNNSSSSSSLSSSSFKNPASNLKKHSLLYSFGKHFNKSNFETMVVNPKNPANFHPLFKPCSKGSIEDIAAALSVKTTTTPQQLNNHVDSFGNTCLHWAAWSVEGSSSIVSLLLEHGSEILRINKSGENPLHMIRNASRFKEFAEFCLDEDSRRSDLLSTRADILLCALQSEDERGFTPSEAVAKKLFSGDEENEISKMMRQIETECEARVSRNSFAVSCVQDNVSGDNDVEQQEQSGTITLKKNKLTLRYGNDRVASIDHSNISFAVIVREQSRVELSFLKPIILKRTQLETHSISFEISPEDEENKTELLHNVLSQSTSLSSFQPNAFCSKELSLRK